MAPTRSRAVYLRQAGFIAIAIIASLFSYFHVFEQEGSFLWLLAALFLLVISCGRPMLTMLNVLGAGIGAMEGIVVILGFAAMTVLLPILAGVFLVVMLIQAARAGPGPRPQAIRDQPEP